jgi:hypothetical protein
MYYERTHVALKFEPIALCIPFFVFGRSEPCCDVVFINWQYIGVARGSHALYVGCLRQILQRLSSGFISSFYSEVYFTFFHPFARREEKSMTMSSCQLNETQTLPSTCASADSSWKGVKGWVQVEVQFTRCTPSVYNPAHPLKNRDDMPNASLRISLVLLSYRWLSSQRWCRRATGSRGSERSSRMDRPKHNRKYKSLEQEIKVIPVIWDSKDREIINIHIHFVLVSLSSSELMSWSRVRWSNHRTS